MFISLILEKSTIEKYCKNFILEILGKFQIYKRSLVLFIEKNPRLSFTENEIGCGNKTRTLHKK